MNVSTKAVRLAFTAIFAAFLALAANSARADSYNLYAAAYSGGDIGNFGFTGDGRSLALSIENPGSCGGDFPCYGIFTPGSGLITTSTQPPITDGDGPGGYSISVIDPDTPWSELYVSDDGNETLIYEGDFSDPSVNSYGDVAFIALNTMYGDVNELAVNETPEPSAFLLLGTGSVAAAALLYRRNRRLSWAGSGLAHHVTNT